MKHQKILSLFNEAYGVKFVTRKWNIVNDKWKSDYGAANKIICNSKVLWSNFCDNNGTYISVQGDITVRVAPATQVSNGAPITKGITKVDETATNDAENLDLILPM